MYVSTSVSLYMFLSVCFLEWLCFYAFALHVCYYISVYVRLCVSLRVCLYIFVSVCASVCFHECLCLHVCLLACLSICFYVCASVFPRVSMSSRVFACVSVMRRQRVSSLAILMDLYHISDAI